MAFFATIISRDDDDDDDDGQINYNVAYRPSPKTEGHATVKKESRNSIRVS